jgi:hypothetical protein
LLIGNVLGLADGHGEIVGFRGVIPVISTDPLNIFSVESYPLALDARGGWPRGQGCDEAKTDAECRRYHMGKWESDPGYLYKKGYEPYNPGLCMVSGDLCNILDIVVADTNVNAPPVADAGPDQILECSSPNGTEVMLDGSGSTDPEGDPLSFSWSGPFGDWIGQTIYPKLPVGTHSITLTVDDGNGNTDTDTLSVTVADTTPPSLSVSLSPTSLWPPNHKMRPINASIRTSDACDAAPNVKLVSIISSQPDNGVGDGNTNNDIQGASFGTDDRTFLLRAEVSGKGARQRIYTVTYSSTDALGNVGEDGSASVTVTQSRAQPRDSLR